MSEWDLVKQIPPSRSREIVLSPFKADNTSAEISTLAVDMALEISKFVISVELFG